MHPWSLLVWLGSLAGALLCCATAAPPRLKVSDNRRFLVTEDGKPFFWLGDTAWELFHRLNREEADLYLRTRAEQGFTVIQAVALAELDGLNTPNAYGHRPLVDNDPTRPDVKDGPANDYWDHVDFVVQTANSLGLTMALLPTWGDKWNAGDNPPVLNPANAEVYGEWLGRRYADSAVVWVLGGDREVTSEQHYATLRALARGLKRGDGGRHLMTFHPRGGHGSSEYFHNEDWLDFNMRQNGHVDTCDSYLNTHADYDLQPPKPVLDGEPLYEDHPLWFRPDERGHSVAADVRRALYWDLFGGACGHTYGHHSVWQMWAPPRKPVNRPLMPWQQALHQPGARQMKFGRFLMESRPFLTRIPDDSVIVPAEYPSAVPGRGRYRFMATRDSEGSFAMVYAPVGRAFSVHMDKVSGGTVRAWWYDPRTGEALHIGEFPAQGQREFLPPTPGEELDWILVLDDATRGFAPPGQAH
jgi:hypothetical protein